jgi:hypothetical protein
MSKLAVGVARVLLFCALLLMLPAIAASQLVSFSVTTTRSCQQTTLRVSKGQTISISANSS